MQAKAEPFREGVVVIKEDTTMEELQELGIRFQEKFGVTPVQIAIHKDEGHWQGEVWKPNLHAHIVFDWYDHSTGKSIKTTSLDAIEMHLQRKFSLSWDIRDRYVRDYLKNSIGFTEVEIKNNIEVFRRASELLPDLLSELTLLKGKSRDKKNPKGWII